MHNATNVTLANGTYNDQDQLTNYEIKNAGGTTLYNYTYTYDDFGNRLTKVDTTNNIREEYVYNSLGAMTSYIRKNNSTNAVLKTITYQNDALGRRITKTEDGVLQVRYIYDEGIRLVGEVSPNGDVLTHYIYSDLKSHTPIYMRRGSTNYKLATNEQGSIRYVYLATTGAVTQELSYDEFGNVLTDTSVGFQSLGFAGGLYDPDTKLTRFGARDYDAETGRWTSKDPIRFEGGDVNLYGYVTSNPINNIDPTGLAQICKRALSGGTPINLQGGVFDYLDLETVHEHIFYDDGDDIGYYDSGIQQNSENKSKSTCSKKKYDDKKIRDAVKKVVKKGRYMNNNYNQFTNNCQDFISDVLREY